MLMNSSIRRLGQVVTLVAGAGLAGTVVAQDDIEDAGLDPALERAIIALATAPASSPARSFGSPLGFGANLGDVFGGIGGTEITTPSNSSDEDDLDGSMVVGFGLGDGVSSIGAVVSFGIISLQDGFGEDGNVNFKLHSYLGNGWGVAAGAENLGGWGKADSVDSSHYAVVSKVTALRPENPENPLALTINGGIGDNRFDDFGEDDLNAFGSVALNFTRTVGGIVDWTGRQLNVGMSFVPIRYLPISVTVGASNVTEEGNRDVAFAGSVGLSYNFLR